LLKDVALRRKYISFAKTLDSGMDPIGSLLAMKASGDRGDSSLVSIDHGRRRRVGDLFGWNERPAAA
jgi:hypothetical protein